MKAISLHSIVPVRTEAREGAEQETQMLFGELCDITEKRDHWYAIRLEGDGEAGWVDAKMIAPIGGKDYREYKRSLKHPACVFMPMAYAVSENNGQTIPLSAGTRLANYENGRFEVLGVGFRIDPGMVLTSPMELNQTNLLQAVRFFLNVPYQWGGKNAMGMDCSGFVQTILSFFGRHLSRNASQQALQGRAVLSLQQSKPGDLVFFCSPGAYTEQGDTRNAPITHVGILIDSERVIHCSGRVKVEKIDEHGIFSVEQADSTHPEGIYTHRTVRIRRI